MRPKCLVILFEAAPSGNVNNSPSAVWLKNKHPDIDFTFVMRGDVAVSQHLGFYQTSIKSFAFLKGLLLSSTFRRKVKDVQQQLDLVADSYDYLWVRGPGIIPLYHGLKVATRPRFADKQKLILHLCANRLTMDFLLKHFSLGHCAKFLSGKIAHYLVKRIRPFVHHFLYTGSQVKRNFTLPDSAQYLIDTVVYEQTAKAKTKNIIFLGRIEKLAGFKKQL